MWNVGVRQDNSCVEPLLVQRLCCFSRLVSDLWGSLVHMCATMQAVDEGRVRHQHHLHLTEGIGPRTVCCKAVGSTISMSESCLGHLCSLCYVEAMQPCTFGVKACQVLRHLGHLSGFGCAEALLPCTFDVKAC